MNTKMLKPLMLSLVTVVGINYLMHHFYGDTKKDSGVIQIDDHRTSGHIIVEPSKQELCAPLNAAIELMPIQDLNVANDVVIETPLAHVTFSARGAVIAGIKYPEYHGQQNTILSSIGNQPRSNDDHVVYDKGLGFVAINRSMPQIYTLAGYESEDGLSRVHYELDLGDWKIHKTFVVHHNSYQIDLIMNYDRVVDNCPAITPRLFIPAPQDEAINENSNNLIVWSDAQQQLEMKDVAGVQNIVWYWKTSRLIFGGADRFFVHAVCHDNDRFVRRAYSALYNEDKHVVAVLEGPSLQASSTFNMMLYCGPKVIDRLAAVDERLEEILAFGWLSSVCKFMIKLLGYIVSIVGNYGWAIILLGIILKVPFVPLSMYARARMERYQKFQPTIARINAKYSQDARRRAEELMKFHKDHNLSPASSLIGCLPTLLQIPIMWGLYRVLSSYINLYHAPFILWIKDLSAKDPYYVLPILFGLSMVIMMAYAAFQDERQRVANMMMSLVMMGVLAGFPAGLVLFWLVNNVVTIIEEYVRKYVVRW